jgi:DNA-binding CsgD family transcriptional regulator
VELLSDRDVRGLLGFLHEAAEVDGPDAFTEEVVEAFWQLIPVDHGASCNTFSGVDPDVAPEARSLLSFSEIDCDWCAHVDDPWTEELDEACRVYIERDDPHPPVPQFINRAVRRSDLVPRAEYCRRGLWADVERLVGAEDQLCLWLEVPGENFLRRMFFLTTRRDGISDRDLRVLELLTPHLIRLYSRAATRRTTPRGLEALTPREREVITMIAAGRTNRETARYLWISPHTVRAHLEHIFEKLEVTTRAAAVARVLGDRPAT